MEKRGIKKKSEDDHHAFFRIREWRAILFSLRVTALASMTGNGGILRAVSRGRKERFWKEERAGWRNEREDDDAGTATIATLSTLSLPTSRTALSFSLALPYPFPGLEAKQGNWQIKGSSIGIITY